MHLVEQYALSCGVKIDKPTVETNYFPLPFSKYIVVHPSSGMAAKNYDYYKDVLELIAPLLRKAGIHIVQMGGPEDPVLPSCYALNGRTTLAQSFFIIQQCILLLGNDSFSTHIAGGFNKKIVSLYSNLFKECCQPYWGDSKKQILIQADRCGEKPSFSNTEAPKVVNNIKPEEIARAVLKLLKIKSSLLSYETLNTGLNYHTDSLEIIPDFFAANALKTDQSINLRLDYEFKPEIATEWGFHYKSHFIIDRPMELNYFNVIRKNLVKISVYLNDEITEEYVRDLRNVGCPVELIAPDDENLINLRLEFIDWGVDKIGSFSKKDLDSAKKICDNTCYKSSKTILSKGKQYSSKAAWLIHQEKNSKEKIIDNEEFWQELDYFRIYNP